MLIHIMRFRGPGFPLLFFYGCKGQCVFVRGESLRTRLTEQFSSTEPRTEQQSDTSYIKAYSIDNALPALVFQAIKRYR